MARQAHIITMSHMYITHRRRWSTTARHRCISTITAMSRYVITAMVLTHTIEAMGPGMARAIGVMAVDIEAIIN